jgi:hypothetical protein
MFEGRRIEVGDVATFEFPIRRIAHDGTISVATGVGEAWFTADDIKSLTPAPRPLVPGPAVLDPETTYAQPVTVIAADGRRAWIRGRADAGAEIVETIRLRNTEGAAS